MNYTVSPLLLVKVLLAGCAVVFTWFFCGETISAEDTDQLLASAAVGFGLASVIV